MKARWEVSGSGDILGPTARGVGRDFADDGLQHRIRDALGTVGGHTPYSAFFQEPIRVEPGVGFQDASSICDAGSNGDVPVRIPAFSAGAPGPEQSFHASWCHVDRRIQT